MTMTTTHPRLGRLKDHLSSGDIITDYAEDYAEPGYHKDTDTGMIVFGDWNDKRARVDDEWVVIDDSPSRLAAVLERAGHTIEWCDEWWTCDECGEAIRSAGNSYSWRPSYVILEECSVVCRECVADDIPAYVDHLNRNDDTADTFDVDWSEHGWHRHPSTDTYFENGWHPGQNDTPAELAERFGLADTDHLWQITSVGQFDMRFVLWVRDDETDAEW